ncbi:ABC transporter ATP-binding protein [Carboxydochorda subterranea]|uniref:ABC transporter ATP-binding protein n=1 Tax=Carboxydichorda subterranea TaxID=3109565 RepID=A0ABZ1BZC0_9FIRM|nr:ABC transporter ATP-binding protein [Limnochorda sp. L945t]WRP18147.1 ABC transporter ATP-binding protein [Limnochorda sp. L945t]
MRAVGTLLEVRGLRAGYVYRDGAVEAVRGVDLDLAAGEFLGLAGESGCGKTTLAFAVAGLLPAPGQVLGGEVRFDGRDLTKAGEEALRRLRGKEMAIVFQASMNVLNPVLRIGDQMADALRAHGVTERKAIDERIERMLQLVGLASQYRYAYPHQLSGGMRQRVVIATALALDPRLVIMDEPTTGLDVVVQRTILQEIDELRRRLGFAVLFITHDLSLLVEISDTIAIMYAGALVERAPSRELYERPLHPYTERLMAAFPPISGPRERLRGIAGQPPDLRGPARGCPFAPRCERRLGTVCEAVTAPLQEVAPGHWVACHLYGENAAAAGALARSEGAMRA